MRNKYIATAFMFAPLIFIVFVGLGFQYNNHIWLRYCLYRVKVESNDVIADKTVFSAHTLMEFATTDDLVTMYHHSKRILIEKFGIEPELFYEWDSSGFGKLITVWRFENGYIAIYAGHVLEGNFLAIEYLPKATTALCKPASENIDLLPYELRSKMPTAEKTIIDKFSKRVDSSYEKDLKGKVFGKK